MKKVGVEIDVPDGMEFDRLHNVHGRFDPESPQGNYISFFCAEFKPKKKKQIIFTSTGEKERVPKHGEWICNVYGSMVQVNGVIPYGDNEIFIRDEKWV